MSRAHRARLKRGRAPFPGGAFSAVLLTAAAIPGGEPILAWAALIPLLFSLERHGNRAAMRLVHGAAFGTIHAVTAIPWLPAFFRGGAEAGDGLASGLGAGAHAFLHWGLLGGAGGLFALAAGPIFRSQRPVLLAGGIPVLWTGIEVLRGWVPESISPWLSSWLLLGYAIPAGSPEAGLASLAGVHALSFALALTSSTLFLALRSPFPARQVALGLAACLVPLSCRAGGEILFPATGKGGISAVAVSARGRDAADFARLTRPFRGAGPALVVWPLVAGPAAAAEVPLRFRELDLEQGAALISGFPGAGGSSSEVIALIPGAPASSDPSRRVVFAGAGIGVGLGAELDSPGPARRLCAAGAEILVIAAHGGSRGGPRAALMEARMQAYRAVENGRFVVRSGSGAFIADPSGRRVAGIAPELEGAEIQTVAYIEARSLYARGGWWLEPACALAAAAMILAGRAISRSPACPRAAPRGGPCPSSAPRSS